MHPNRLQHLYRLWQKYLQTSPLPQADRWLHAEFKANKSFGKQDRTFYADMLFAGIRHALFALSCQEAASGVLNVNAADIETWMQTHADNQLVWQKIKAMPASVFFNWVFLRIGKHKSDADNKCQDTYINWLSQQKSLSAQMLWHSLPPAFHDALVARFKDFDLQLQNRFLALQEQKPPMWLRLKLPQHEEEVLTELKARGFSIIHAVRLNHSIAIAISGSISLYELKSYQSGLCEIQDLASQMIGDAIMFNNKKPVLLDACAGGGGKSVQLAALLNNQGVLYASDIREYKLDEVKRRAKKGQFSNVRTFVWDWSQEVLPSYSREIERNQGFDAVLVDAPCSSSGTWRRNPDAKWRFDIKELLALNQLQLTLLSNASRVVKAGGQLLYSSCSFIREENECIIEQFLAQHPQFSLAETKVLGLPYADSDSMFLASMFKKES